MAQLIQDNITFNNVSLSGALVGTKVLVSEYNIDENRNIISNYPIINSIDIDWNNAEIDNGVLIKTTGQLLSYIKNLNSQYESLLNQYNELVNEIDARNHTIATAINDLYDITSNVGNVSYDDPRLKQYINAIISEYMDIYHTRAFMYVGKDIPNEINDNNSTVITSLNEIFIYKENDTDEDVEWYFAIPNTYSYNIYDDNKEQSQNDFFELLDSNFLNGYQLYKSRTFNRVISVILTKND